MSGLYTCVRLTTAHPRLCRGWYGDSFGRGDGWETPKALGKSGDSCGRGEGVETPKSLGESEGLLAWSSRSPACPLCARGTYCAREIRDSQRTCARSGTFAVCPSRSPARPLCARGT